MKNIQNVVFVKWGDKYSSDHVINLYKSLFKYNSECNYYCLTDSDADTLIEHNIKTISLSHKPALKKWWNKLKMFDKNLPVNNLTPHALVGKCLYFDLDIKINSDPFLVLDQINWDKLTMIDCHWKQSDLYHRLSNYDVNVNSSVLAWDTEQSNAEEIWDHFIDSGYKDYFLRKYVGIDRYIVHEDFSYNTFPQDFIQSYKYEKNKIAPVTTFEEVDFEGTNIKS